MNVGHTIFEQIINVENLFLSWLEFRKGKRQKQDVIYFERNLEDNLFKLNWELKNSFYRHGPYKSFVICDPKRRVIHKATVRDRIVHHAVFRILNPLFDPIFFNDSYSCRLCKGTHRAVLRLEQFLKNVSRNYRQNCYALKCDISQFFASVCHRTLKNLILKKIKDENALKLIFQIIESFTTPNPLGGGLWEERIAHRKSHFAIVREYLFERVG